MKAVKNTKLVKVVKQLPLVVSIQNVYHALVMQYRWKAISKASSKGIEK